MKYPTLMQTVEDIRTHSDEEIERLLLIVQDRRYELGMEASRIRHAMLDLKRQQADNDDAAYGQSMLHEVLTAELDGRRRRQLVKLTS